MTTHLTEDDLILHYYGETDEPAEARATAHLRDCADCHRQYTRLQRVLAIVESAATVDAPEGYERSAWARLEPTLPVRQTGWFSSFVFSPARLAWAAMVVALVIGAFMAGRLSPHTPGRSGAAQAAATNANQIRERILLVDLGDHLERSEMVLVELVSAEGTGPVDISTEQARAQQLLASNRLYRQTAMKTGDAAMASVLDELERVLVDLAASPKTVSQEDLDSMRRRIESKELLFKVQVVSSSLQQRQKAAVNRTITQG
jgi:hypothetical protein